MKKKILFIALYYPPSEGVADIRPANIVTQLNENNFDLTVLTIKEDYFIKKTNNTSNLSKDIEEIRIKYPFRFDLGNIKGNKLIPRIAQKIILKILPFFGMDYLSFWQRNAIKEVVKKNQKYDYIIATGPPFSSFILAERLSKKLDSNYILDYRDLWTLSPHGNNAIKNKINVKKELKVIERASLITFVSSSMQKAMNEKYKIKKSIVLTNGYCSNSFELIKDKNFNKFTISYVGSFYLPKRVIDPIFRVFEVLKNDYLEIYNSINFIYCGRAGDYIENRAKEYAIGDIVENRNLISREESYSITKSSNLSLVITSVNKEGDLGDKSIITGKVFEALGMGTKVLCIAPMHSDIRGILSIKNRGKVFYGDEITRIVDYIIGEVRNNRTDKNHDVNNMEYEWSHLINKFVKEINEII